MKIMFEHYHNRYTIETINPKQDDFDAAELKELFSRLLVCAGYGPSVIDVAEGGKYEYVDPDYEVVVKREYLEELEEKVKQGRERENR